MYNHNDHLRVCVKSRKMAEEYSKENHDETAILISITAKDQENADVTCTDENGLKDILFLHFNDTDSMDENSGHSRDCLIMQAYLENYLVIMRYI